MRLEEHLGQLLGRERLHAPAAAVAARPRRRPSASVELVEQRLQLLVGVASPIAYSLPRSEKYTSKTVSNAFQWAAFFTSVAARAYLNASRSSSGMCLTASMASRFSVRLTGRPASAQLLDEPGEEVEHRRAASATSHFWSVGRLPGQLLGRLGDVGLVLEEDVERLGGLSASTCSMPSSTSVRAQSSVSDTDGAFFSSSWRIERTMRAIWSARLSVTPGDLGEDDLLLALEVRVVDVQEEAAPLERLGQLTGVVRREEHERDLLGGDACRARGSTPGSRRGSRAAGPRSRPRRGRPRR